MSKIIGTETFEIGNGYTIECEMKSTRSGTRENAVLLHNGLGIGAGTDFWSNRPWYPFTYANAIRNALQSNKDFTPEQVDIIFDGLKRKDSEKINSMFKTVGAIAKIGEIMTDNQKDSNDWKARMLKAGITGLSIPEDWDELSEDEKTRRLDGVIAIANNEVTQ